MKQSRQERIKRHQDRLQAEEISKSLSLEQKDLMEQIITLLTGESVDKLSEIYRYIQGEPVFKLRGEDVEKYQNMHIASGGGNTIMHNSINLTPAQKESLRRLNIDMSWVGGSGK